MLHYILLYGLSMAIAACPPNCFSCATDGTCLGPDGRTWGQTNAYERFCKDGFFGSTCNSICPVNCAQAYCSAGGYCMATPTRTQGSDYQSAGSYDRAIFCKDGFSGSTCGSNCPVNCAQAYCSANGYCMATPTRTPGSDYGSANAYDRASFCKDGFSGNTCMTSCPVNCAMKYCSASGYCMATPARTPGSDYDSAGSYDRAIFCKDGFSGSTCGNKCPVNCAQAYCSANGYCMATPTRTPGSDYGSANAYDRASFCKDGFSGVTCGNTCPLNCAQAYCSASGYCMATPTRTPKSDFDSAGSYDRAIFCKDGYSGSTCGNKCPVNCAQPYCSASGYCMATPTRTPSSDYGSANPYDRASFCKDGFSGSICGNTCPLSCVQAYCSAQGYCMATPTRTPGSDFDSAGSYDRASFCKDGYSGSKCVTSCPVNCAQPYCSANGYCMATPMRTDKSDYGSANSYDRAIFCKDGFSGSVCGASCPLNCATQFCSASGYCMATPTRTPKSDSDSAGTYDRAIFCKDGYWGGTCANKCPANCAQPYCSAAGYCMATPARTPSSDYGSADSYDRASFCKDGYSGSTCANACPTNCEMPWCTANGYCMACTVKTPLGDFASAGANDRAHFCKDGFSGSTCGNICSRNCAQAWCSASGYCMAQAERVPKGDYNSASCSDPAIFCKAGWSGSTCMNACPATCASNCSSCGNCNIVPSPTPVNPYPRLACAQPTPVPPTCRTDSGQCSWYSSCLQQSTPNPCSDIANVMQAKCSEYQALESSLSAAGQQWSKSVRGCLQNQMSTLWAARTFGLVQCSSIQSEFFDNPLPCYLSGPVPFCNLPTMDTIKIMLHANSVLVSSNWWSPLSAGAQLLARCAASYFQVNAVRRQGADPLVQADIESDLRQFFQSRFGPQGWNTNITSINVSALALGFLPAIPSNPPLTSLAPYFVTQALIAWSQTPTGLYYQVSINDGPPLHANATDDTPELKKSSPAAPFTPADRDAVVLPITVALAALIVVAAVALLIPRKKQALADYHEMPVDVVKV